VVEVGEGEGAGAEGEVSCFSLFVSNSSIRFRRLSTTSMRSHIWLLNFLISSSRRSTEAPSMATTGGGTDREQEEDKSRRETPRISGSDTKY
jgi:hypothetical protein